MAQGIDVYTAYQQVNDWGAVRGAGYEFCYVKVSDGGENRDDGGYGPAGAAAGVAMGAYHYAQPGDPVAQANRLVDRCIEAGLYTLAPALDLEDPFTPGPAAADFAIAFANQVRARGHRPCLYGNNAMLSGIVDAVRAAVPGLLVWVARYGADPTVRYDLWQYSSGGQVPGVAASAVDLNTGVVPLNATTATDEEDDSMLVPAGNDHVDVVVAGKTKLYVACSNNQQVFVSAINFFGDSGDAEGGTGVGGQQTNLTVTSNRPGPIPIPAGAAMASITYEATHSFGVGAV